MSFESYKESLETIPHDLERSLTLLKELDKRSADAMKKINENVEKYKTCNTPEEKKRIRNTTNELYDSLASFADDKIELALQCYDNIDKMIVKLTQIVDVKNNTMTEPPGFRMPLSENEPRFCICGGVSFGEMIACDNEDCVTEWFHFACVGISTKPKGEWYCEQCTKLRQDEKPKVKSKKRKSKGR